MGMWEASMNNTHRAIDMISKEVVICDWHYERPDKSAVYFAMKGFSVITCPWRKPELAVQQVKDMLAFRQHATKAQRERYLGVVETVWSPVSSFLNEYYGKPKVAGSSEKVDTVNTAANTFKAMYDQIGQIEKQ
ncbi:MAG: hypothetical protein EOO06_21200 [Chitinophagaceae bacterium]|nr:MAG: hypothetical protein EOO06_21200 [Chitinophagaceae bacterium]